MPANSRTLPTLLLILGAACHGPTLPRSGYFIIATPPKASGWHAGDTLADAEWTPTPEEIATLESHLPAFLEAATQRLPRPLGDFGRQYGGYVVGHDSLIYVNFFAHYPELDSLKVTDRRPVIVCDGGAAYFGVSFDPRTSRFFGLSFNGDA